MHSGYLSYCPRFHVGSLQSSCSRRSSMLPLLPFQFKENKCSFRSGCSLIPVGVDDSCHLGCSLSSVLVRTRPCHTSFYFIIISAPQFRRRDSHHPRCRKFVSAVAVLARVKCNSGTKVMPVAFFCTTSSQVP